MLRLKVIKEIVHNACRGRVEGQVRAIWCSVFAAGVEKRPNVGRGENGESDCDDVCQRPPGMTSEIEQKGRTGSTEVVSPSSITEP